MAHNQYEPGLPMKAASAMAQYVPAMFVIPASALSETVHAAGSINDVAFGMTIATVATAGDPVDVQWLGVTKARAGASLGAGAKVAVGSTNGVLIPLNASSGAAPTAIRYTIGTALKNAAAGDFFPLFVDPDQLL